MPNFAVGNLPPFRNYAINRLLYATFKLSIAPLEFFFLRWRFC